MRAPATGAFQFGGVAPYADFDRSLTPVNSYGQGSAAGSYTVRAGDTLQSIAATLWGDASLWYKLAEFNGAGGLTQGQSLHPVKFVGSPTDPANVVILPRDVHRQQVTPWWNQLQKALGY